MTRILLAFSLVLYCLISVAHAQGNQAAAPDTAAIIRVGKASLKRLETESASWTTTTSTPGGAEFVVEVLLTPTKRRLVLSIETQGRRQELARLIQTDDVWYVVQGGKAGKYRPYEAPLDVPTSYMYLSRAELKIMAETSSNTAGTFEGIEDNVATYRHPITNAARQVLESTVAQFERLKQANPAAIPPELTKSMNQSKELLAKGLVSRIDLTTSMLVEFGALSHRSKVTDFRWLKQVDAKEFSTEGYKWDDVTNDPTLGDRDELVMLSHSRFWEPASKSHDTDGRLVELGSNRIRRIPFQKDVVSTGCFSKDRTRVIVTGLDTMTTVMGLYEINLQTTENRQLGGEALSTGMSFFPALSPDGKTVAVLHQESNAKQLQIQIYLVDLASGEAKKLHEPKDSGPISWFPDGKSLLILERVTTDRSKPAVATMSSLSLDGQVTKLCPGDFPAFLGDGTRILFKDPTSTTWKTCNHKGGDIQDYADGGLTGYGFPAPSSDGKRLLLMHFQTGKAPMPVVFEVGSSEGKPLKLPPGLWALPAWR